MKRLLPLLLIFVSLSVALHAHQTALSYLKITVAHNDTMEIILKKPLADLEKDDLKIIFPRGCYTVGTEKRYEARYLITAEKVVCTQKSLSDAQIWIANLRESDVGVIADITTPSSQVRNLLIRAENPLIILQKAEQEKSFLSFVKLGIVHILTGYDHLLFVLSLMLLVPDRKRLLLTVTAFTVAHSVTLGLATLGVVHISVPYIEALIALSIIVLVREILVGQNRTVASRYPWSMAFLFGLIHGFGFASALDEVGISSENLYTTLFLFNLGVEVGQILFIVSVWSIIRLFYRKTERYHHFIQVGTLYLIGMIASYWFIERLMLLI